MVRLSIFDNTLVLLVGCLTAIMGGIFGLFQNDLKRVIAFSTCSQLGYSALSIINTDLLSTSVRLYSSNNEDDNSGNINKVDIIPEHYVSRYDVMNRENIILAKRTYKGIGVIYLWINRLTYV